MIPATKRGRNGVQKEELQGTSGEKIERECKNKRKGDNGGYIPGDICGALIA